MHATFIEQGVRHARNMQWPLLQWSISHSPYVQIDLKDNVDEEHTGIIGIHMLVVLMDDVGHNCGIGASLSTHTDRLR